MSRPAYRYLIRWELANRDHFCQAMEIRELNVYRIGLRDVIKVADSIEDGFQDDNLYMAVRGPNYTFTHPVPPEQKNAYLRSLLSFSFKLWLSVRDVNSRSFVAIENGRCYGFVRWVIPQQYRRPAPWYHRLGNWFIKLASRILDKVLFFGDTRPPFAPPALEQLRRETFPYLQLELSPEQRQELAHCSKDELVKAKYDQGDYTRCNNMVIRKGLQGSGIGSLLFQESIKRLESLPPIFIDGPLETVGPAKLGLLSSPMGVKFYKKHGFRERGVHPAACEGLEIASAFMEKIQDEA